MAPAIHQLSDFRDFLELLVAFGQLREPLTSPTGLRQAIELFARLLELSAIESAWIERLRTVLADEHVFNIVLAIVQYLVFFLWEADEEAVLDFTGESCGVDAPSFAAWFPLARDLLTLRRNLRGV
jgi:hypothetical protein